MIWDIMDNSYHFILNTKKQNVFYKTGTKCILMSNKEVIEGEQFLIRDILLRKPILHEPLISFKNYSNKTDQAYVLP